MKINYELLGIIVAVSVPAVIFGIHYLAGLIEPTYGFSDYCQKMNIDC